MNLKHLTDKQLLKDTKSLAAEERKLTSKLLHHLKEIEDRKLFCELGYNSLFQYIVQELGYSEGAATRRINVARLIKDIPEIQVKIETGDLNLSNLSKAADKFKQENITDLEFKKEILASIENTSTRNCEKALSEIFIPGQLPANPRVHTRFLPFNIKEETHEKWDELRGLLAHKRYSKEEIFEKALDIAIERLKIQKFHLNSKSEAESKGRYVTASVKKDVYLRDKVCQKCGSKHGLQYDHRVPYSMGGKSNKENLRILCRNCNQRSRITSRLRA